MNKVLLIAFILAAAAGCNQQGREPKSTPLPSGAVPMRSPEEISQLEQIAKQSPKQAEAWIMLGDALMDSSRYGEAADAYSKALALKPRDVDVRVDMGTCLKNAGKPQQAIEEYRKALKIAPKHPNAHRNMGVVLAYDLHDRKSAIKEFETYLQVAPAAPDSDQIRQLIENLKSGR